MPAASPPRQDTNFQFATSATKRQHPTLLNYASDRLGVHPPYPTSFSPTTLPGLPISLGDTSSAIRKPFPTGIEILSHASSPARSQPNAPILPLAYRYRTLILIPHLYSTPSSSTGPARLLLPSRNRSTLQTLWLESESNNLIFLSILNTKNKIRSH